MKPPGVSLTMNEYGPSLRVTRPSRAEDLIWEAVQEAQAEGRTPEWFVREVREAWAQARDDQKDSELEALR